jgi:GAF domain-containing protein
VTSLAAAALVQLAYVGMTGISGRHLVESLSAWPVAILVAVLAARGLARLSQPPSDEAVRADGADRIHQLEATNALLHRLASTPNVTALFKVLSSRIGGVVPCDRVAIALTDTGHEFQMFVAQSAPDRAPAEPPQVHHFLRAGTLIADVAASGTARFVSDLRAEGIKHLDANVLASSGLRSAILLPLAAEGLNLGVLFVLAKTDSLTESNVDTLRPIADIVAVAFATQSLARALGRTQMAKDMADVMFSLANEINSALQAIVGHCELLSREYQDPPLLRDLAMVSRQAARATEVLAQVQQLAETRLQRAASVANLLEDARLEPFEPIAGGDVEDLLNR